MRYYPIHTHLHCAHEASASIGSHMSYAKRLGIHHIWTTEHDTRIGKPKGEYLHFFFPRAELFTQLPSGRQAGFQEIEENSGKYSFAETGKGIELHMTAEAGQRESMFFHTQGKAHSDPLFSHLTVEMDADLEIADGGQVCVDFVLSAQPPTYQQARLRYVLGAMPEPKPEEPEQYVTFPEKTDGIYRFSLTEDVCDTIGGLDNALCNLYLVAENGAKIRFRSFRFFRELEYEKTRQAQIALTKKLTEKWGVTAFVGFEVTGAGNHKNCYSTKVPVIEYAAFHNKVTNEQAVEYLQSYDAVYSWNHPLTAFAGSGKGDAFFLEIAEELVSSRVYGASMIEVGFPCGRGGVDEREYLRLWDRLSENGILITGNGDSDNHHALEKGWTEGNNFCVFAGLTDDEPPTEENFVKAFRRGSIWSGNPVVIKNLSLTGEGKPQGSLLRGEKAKVQFAAWDIQCGGYAQWIVNGTVAQRMEIQNGAVSGQWTLRCEQKYNFARVELYNEENMLIAFSNPIYLVGQDTQIKER